MDHRHAHGFVHGLAAAHHDHVEHLRERGARVRASDFAAVQPPVLEGLEHGIVPLVHAHVARAMRHVRDLSGGEGKKDGRAGGEGSGIGKLENVHRKARKRVVDFSGRGIFVGSATGVGVLASTRGTHVVAVERFVSGDDLLASAGVGKERLFAKAALSAAEPTPRTRRVTRGVSSDSNQAWTTTRSRERRGARGARSR